jgi:TRIAD3 protein (E3 ubiquitin-protein ligase RNF216)
MNEIIDISSSPEPSPRPRTKTLPSRGKARLDNNTIVLTDSEDEDYAIQRPYFHDRGTHMGAGPSRRPAPVLHHKKDAASGSLENIPAKRRPKSKSVPLFLPSDEENEPPELAGVEEEEPIIVDNLPSPPPDPIPGYVDRVLDVLPDALPDYVLILVQQHYPESRDQVVETVLHALFENPTYPKVDKKGKRKHIEEDVPSQGDARGQPKVKLDYASKDRAYNGGVHYEQLAVDQLMLDFPLIPKPHIRRVLLNHHSLYAPTHMFLAEEKSRHGVLPYTPKTIPSRPAKGKRKALHDAEFEKEREWIISQVGEDPKKDEANAENSSDCEDGIECGCCFSNYSFVSGFSAPICSSLISDLMPRKK